MWRFAVVVVALVLAPRASQAEPARSSATVAITAGPATLSFLSERPRDLGLFGDLGVGWFANDRFALGVRASGMVFSGLGKGFLFGGVGGFGQAWLTDQFWINGGIGLGWYLGSFGNDHYDDAKGPEFDLGIGFAPTRLCGWHVALQASQVKDVASYKREEASFRFFSLQFGFQYVHHRH